MEEKSIDKENNENILKDELVDKENTIPNKVEWIGRPCVTLIRQFICPKCNSVDTLSLLRTLTTNPMKFEYVCTSCGHTIYTNDAITSIVYVDTDAYNKEVERTGATIVKGSLDIIT